MFSDFFIKRKAEKYLAVTADSLGMTGIENKIKDGFVIITIAFNNSHVIRHQINLLDKNLRDKFTHIIIDNSDKEEISAAIKQLSNDFSRTYLKLPANVYKTGSRSHALALNWCMRQLIKKFKPGYFGFIDHDIYPVKKEEIVGILDKQKIYGLKQERGAAWYLWPGLCFFKYDEKNIEQFDFGTGKINNINVDTGGMLYRDFYSKLNKENILFPSQSYENLRAGEVFQSDKVEYIGNWMHSFNGSYWMEVPGKEKELDLLIEKYLNAND